MFSRIVSRKIYTSAKSSTARPASKSLTVTDIKPELQPYNVKLMAHPIYNAITSVEQCQLFMENHAFAVWDFMSLLKSLQISLTCVNLPWIPPTNPEVAYFMNSIVAGEESDDLGSHDYKKATSHYELYLASMVEVGASTEPISYFVGKLQRGEKWHSALQQTRVKYSHLPSSTFDFVEYTMNIVENKSPAEVAASFLFGREDPIPAMFQKLLSQFNEKNVNCPNLKLYLARHIEVDGDHHGPMADLILEKLCLTPEQCEKALDVAKGSIEMRVHLWDGIYSKLK